MGVLIMRIFIIIILFVLQIIDVAATSHIIKGNTNYENNYVVKVVAEHYGWETVLLIKCALVCCLFPFMKNKNFVKITSIALVAYLILSIFHLHAILL